MKSGLLHALCAVIFMIILTAGPGRPQQLIEAVKGGDFERAKELVADNPGIVNESDERNCTALLFAVDGGHGEIVDYLLEQGAELLVHDVDGDGALHWAAYAGREKIARRLIDLGLPVDDLDLARRSPLHYAAMRGHAGVARLLLERGADINLQSHTGETPITYAVLGNHFDAAAVLLMTGADLEIRDDYGRTPLLLAARETGNADMARLLLKYGANVNATDKFGDTPLTLTAWRGFTDAIAVLLEHGAEVPASGEKGEFLLNYAAEKGLSRLFGILLERGADPAIRNNRGGNLLQSAAAGGSMEIVASLHQAGLDPLAGDRYGWNALHYAAYKGRTEVINYLSNAGIDLNPRTLSGLSALNLADNRDRRQIVMLLEKLGAEPAEWRFPVLEGPYIGQELPERRAVLFAPDIVSSNEGQHGSVTFTPDGNEAYWSSFLASDVGYSRSGILTSKRVGGRWTPPRQASFAPAWERDRSGDVPFVSPDGRHIYFLSRRPHEPGGRIGAEYLWIADRNGEDWSEPYLAGGAENPISFHWQFSIDKNRNLYYSANNTAGHGMGDIYCAKFVDGAYRPAENLGTVINSERGESAPYISPEGDYLLFIRDDAPGGFGRGDIYISYRDAGDGWTQPRNLGGEINSPATEMCPIVSPDGRYLFFISQRLKNSNIFWASAEFIRALRP
jgi:ankyrin repeat protein